MAHFVADEKLQGYYVSGGVTINIVKYHFECDDDASLPAQTAFVSSKNIKISMASTAHVIDTDTVYKMDSSGAWVQQSQPWQPLADYSVLSNKPSINGHTLTDNQTGAALGLQDALTFDSTPTQDSTNPVTSGGIWTVQQELTTKEQQNENNILYNIKYGVQNIFRLAAGTRIAGGVTFTINTDGTITLSNTATSDAVFIISGNLNVSDDTYVLYGDGFVSGIFMDTYEDGYTNRRTFTTYAVTNSNTKIWRLIVSAGTDTNGVTIRPMMCLKSLYDAEPTYQPYAMSNADLTAAIQALQAQLANQ